MRKPKTKATLAREEAKNRRSLFVDIDAALFVEMKIAEKRLKGRGQTRRVICEDALRWKLARLRTKYNDGRRFA